MAAGNGRKRTAPSGSRSRSNHTTHSQTTRKSHTRLKRPGFFSWLLAILSVGGVGWFLYQIIRINILPTSMLLIVCALLVVLMTLLLIVWLFHTRRRAAKTIMCILVCLIGAGTALGGFYLKDTDHMFEAITNLTDKQANTLTVYAMKGSEITKPDQIKAGMLVGIDPGDDAAGTEACLEQLRKAGAVFETKEYDSCYELVDALYDEDVTAIVFPESMHAELYEAANDTNKYNALTTFTNSVDHYVYYTDRDQTTVNKANPVGNIMMDPFTVLVSGNDSYGSINQVTRSDVNMLVTVNPRTAQVLILSIPRDSYLPITCKKNQNACAAVAGEDDKLTHSGLYGVGTTESTLEDAFDVEVNYYVRINFSSLINIIDAIGGIDVNVEPGLEVETFYANGTEGVHAGMNHLDGERALAFVRERHAYIDGDNQRIKNQQIVLRALLKALLSPKMVVNYPKVMQALSTAMDTNMTSNELKSLLTLELARFPKWNIQTFALVGEPDMRYSPSNQSDLSVMILGDQEVSQARNLIDQVIAGQTIDLANADQPVETDVINDIENGSTPDQSAEESSGYSPYEDPYASSEDEPYSSSDLQDPYNNYTYGEETSPYHPDSEQNPYGNAGSAGNHYQNGWQDSSTDDDQPAYEPVHPDDPYGLTTPSTSYDSEHETDYGYGY